MDSGVHYSVSSLILALIMT